jgi:hypothetical protein
MMLGNRLVPLLSLLLGTTSLAAAQGQVWVVDDDGGPGVDFTALQEAVDAAADGDTVLVRSGVYEPASVGLQTLAISGKSLVVQAERDARVVLRDVMGGQALAISGVAAGQQVVLRGLRFELAEEGGGPYLPVQILDNAGSVRIEDCVLRAQERNSGLQMIHVASTASLVLTRCEVRAAWATFPVLRVVESSLSCYDTRITAGGLRWDTFPGPANGGMAIQAEESALFLSGSVLKGGTGATGGSLDGTCYGGGDGGDVLRATDCDVVLQDALLVPGAPGASPLSGCEDGEPGEALVLSGGTLAVLEDSTPRLDVASPVRAGGYLRLAFDAPGALAFALVSQHPAADLLAPYGELLVAAPTLLAFPGEVEPYGKTALVQLDALAPGVEAALVHVQGAFLDPLAGTVRLGNATAVTVLGAGL